MGIFLNFYVWQTRVGKLSCSFVVPATFRSMSLVSLRMFHFIGNLCPLYRHKLFWNVHLSLLFRFPGFSNKEWRKLWFSALNYPAEESDRPPSAKEELLLICSRHFTPDSFIDGYRLKKNAVPTLHISVTKTITRVTVFGDQLGAFQFNTERIYCRRAPILRMKTP